MPKVLIVAWHFPPIGGPGTQRTLKYCKYLPDLGWESAVIAGVEPEEHQDPSLLEDVPDEVHVVREGLPNTAWRKSRHWMFNHGVGRIASGIGNWLDFPDTRREWAERVVVPAGVELHKSKKFDVLYTTAYWFSGHFAGFRLKRLLGIPWVADLRDPWADNELLLGHLPGWVRRKHRRAEARMVEEADAVILAHPLVAESFRRRYPRYADKVHAITNGFDPEDYSPFPEAPPGNPNSDQAVRIVHTGSCYGEYGPRRLFDALQKHWSKTAGNDVPVQFRFIGGTGGTAPPSVEGIEIEVTPRVPHAEAIKAQREADVLLNVFDRTVGRIGISGKLFEYLAARRPILAVVPNDGSTAAILRNCRAGWVCDCDRPEEIVASLAESVAAVRSPNFRFNPNKDTIRQYARPELTKQLAGVLDAVL